MNVKHVGFQNQMLEMNQNKEILISRHSNCFEYSIHFQKIIIPSSKYLYFRAVRRIDRTFDQENFVSFLEKEMIPIVLEAKALNNVEVVEAKFYFHSLKYLQVNKTKIFLMTNLYS